MHLIFRGGIGLSLSLLLLSTATAQPGPSSPEPPVHRQESAVRAGARTPCEGGVAGGFPCRNVDLLAFMPVGTIAGGADVELNDIWGWTDPETGREYALVGRTNGTAFVDVTDPVNPVYVGDLMLTSGARPSAWRDVKVYADHAYIVADNAGPHGMQVFDLRQLRDVAQTPAAFTATALYNGIASAHNVAVNEASGYAYAVGAGQGGTTCAGGLHMVDVRDPARPAFAGCFTDVGYVHDVQCVAYEGPDTDYAGREICVASAARRLGIVDVTDKANPVLIAATTYPDVGYVHQGWFTDDQRYFFQDDELDEINGMVPRTRTLIWDLTDLDEPVLRQEYFGQTYASDHNLYIRGRHVYQANYASGLRILDISDVERPREVAFFDTFPASNDPGFQGAWSTYPYFESGTVVVSSIGEGLFVLKPNDLLAGDVAYFNAVALEDVVDFSWELDVSGSDVYFEVEEYTGDRPGLPEWRIVGTLPANTVQDGSYAYRIQDVFPGTHTYRLKIVSAAGEVYSAPVEVFVEVPGFYELDAAYPNPFRERVSFTVAVRIEQRVRIELFDLLGRRVATVFDGMVPANTSRHVTFETPPDLRSGTYIYRVFGEGFVEAHPVVLAR